MTNVEIDLSFFAPQKMSIDMLSYDMSERLGGFVYGMELCPISSGRDSSVQDSGALFEHILVVLRDEESRQAIAHKLSVYNKPILFLRESSHYFSWVLLGLKFLEQYYALGSIGEQLDFLLKEAIAHRASDVHLEDKGDFGSICLLYTSPSPRD